MGEHEETTSMKLFYSAPCLGGSTPYGSIHMMSERGLWKMINPKILQMSYMDAPYVSDRVESTMKVVRSKGLGLASWGSGKLPGMAIYMW